MLKATRVHDKNANQKGAGAGAGATPALPFCVYALTPSLTYLQEFPTKLNVQHAHGEDAAAKAFSSPSRVVFNGGSDRHTYDLLCDVNIGRLAVLAASVAGSLFAPTLTETEMVYNRLLTQLSSSSVIQNKVQLEEGVNPKVVALVQDLQVVARSIHSLVQRVREVPIGASGDGVVEAEQLQTQIEVELVERLLPIVETWRIMQAQEQIGLLVRNVLPLVAQRVGGGHDWSKQVCFVCITEDSTGSGNSTDATLTQLQQPLQQHDEPWMTYLRVVVGCDKVVRMTSSSLLHQSNRSMQNVNILKALDQAKSLRKLQANGFTYAQGAPLPHHFGLVASLNVAEREVANMMAGASQVEVMTMNPESSSLDSSNRHYSHLPTSTTSTSTSNSTSRASFSGLQDIRPAIKGRVNDAVRNLLCELGLDITNEHLKETPKRVTKALLHEILKAYYEVPPKLSLFRDADPARNAFVLPASASSAASSSSNSSSSGGEVVGTLPHTTSGMMAAPAADNLIVVGPLHASSTCAHHLMPFIGTVFIGLLLDDRQPALLGLSKFARVVEYCCAQLGTQEGCTDRIAATIANLGVSDSVAVYFRATHCCMSCRGVRQGAAATLTVKCTGRFLSDRTLQGKFFSSASSGGNAGTGGAAVDSACHMINGRL